MYPYFYHVTSRNRLLSILIHGILPSSNRVTRHGKEVVWLIHSKALIHNTILLKGFSENNSFIQPIAVEADLSENNVYRFGETFDYYTPEIVQPDRILKIILVTGIRKWK